MNPAYPPSSTDLPAHKDPSRNERSASGDLRYQERFRALAQVAGQIVTICDAQGEFTEPQEPWEIFTGQTPSEYMGKGWVTAFHTADVEKVLNLWDKAVRVPVPFRTVFRLRDKDGRYREVTLMATPVIGRDGRVGEWVLVHSEVTDRSGSDEDTARALRELNDLKSAIDEHAIVAITDAKGKITYVNDKFCAISKYCRAELVGQDHRIINSGYHSRRFIRNLWETIQAGRVWKGEIKNKAKDGTYYWVDTTIVPYLGDDGKPIQYIAIRADITDRKQADEQRERALRELNDVKAAIDQHAIVAITDPQGKITYVNDKFCALSKYSKEELLGKDHRIINSGHHPKAFIRSIWETIGSGRVWKGEIKNRAKDGTLYWVDTTIVPYLGEDGRPVQYIAIRADITERKLAEAALNQAQAELQQHAANLEQTIETRTAALRETIAELETFSYSVSHDMRAPLRAMQSFSRILTEDCSEELSPEGKDYLRRIASAAARMDSLIKDVLTYSKVARTDLPLQRVELGTLLKDIIDSYPTFQFPDAIIEMKGAFPPVLAIPAVLTQCISNIMANAVKFVSPGVTPKIDVWTEASDEGRKLRLFFRDNGFGIEKEAQEAIFGIFQRVSKDYEGTGIGLSIVKKGIERMGGAVGLESETGKGSTFWLELLQPPDDP